MRLRCALAPVAVEVVRAEDVLGPQLTPAAHGVSHGNSGTRPRTMRQEKYVLMAAARVTSGHRGRSGCPSQRRQVEIPPRPPGLSQSGRRP
jgi:hypothetical protein